MNNTTAKRQVLQLAEEALFLAGEQREFITREVRLLKFLDTQEELDRADEVGARKDLRSAQRHLADIEERNAQKAEVRAQIRADFTEQSELIDTQSRTLSKDATAAGFPHARNELLANGGVQRIVDARKAGTVSQSESEAI